MIIIINLGTDALSSYLQEKKKKKPMKRKLNILLKAWMLLTFYISSNNELLCEYTIKSKSTL